MPDLTLTVTAAQWTRIQAAFQAACPDETINAAFMATWTKRQIKALVRRYESGLATGTADAAVDAELDAEGWNE